MRPGPGRVAIAGRGEVDGAQPNCNSIGRTRRRVQLVSGGIYLHPLLVSACKCNELSLHGTVQKDGS